MSGSSGGTPGATGYLVSDLVGLALRQLGVGAQGTVPATPDMSDGVMHLNLMLAQWQRRRWMVPNLVDVSAISAGGPLMLIGPSAGDAFSVPLRPDRIEGAYARWTGAGFAPADFSATDFSPQDYNTSSLNSPGLVLDYPITILSSYEDYAQLGLKNLRTWPAAVFYTPTYPDGQLMFWPIPAAGLWELHLIVKQPLPATLTLTSALKLDPSYWDAIMWTLAVRMAPSYGQEPSPAVVAMARAAEQTIRLANAAMPRLTMPNAVRPRRIGGGVYPTILAGVF